MGATKTTESKFNFYRVQEYKFVKNCSQTDEGAVPYQYNDKTYYKQCFKALNGHLYMMQTETKTNQSTNQEYELLKIYLKDNQLDTFESIEVYYHSREAQSFLNAIKNANLNEELSIEVCKDKEKETTFFIIKQKGEIIKRYFTKDNPNGLPPLENVGTAKKPKWIDVKMFEFYDVMIKDLNEALYAKRESAKVPEVPENLQPINEFETQK